MFDSGQFWMARLKVRRATDLVGDAAAELDRYRHSMPVEHELKQDAEGWIAESTILADPVYAGAIIGDAVHNLRSSLDLMASELARLNRQKDKNVYFPIADTADNLEGLITSKNFHLAGEDAVTLLREFAPYRGGNDALRALHELDIYDKHTALVPTIQQLKTKILTPMRDGKLVPEETSITHIPESLKLVFPNDSAFAGDEVIPTLEKLVELVTGIIEAFASLVTARTQP